MITFTDGARTKVVQILASESRTDLALRFGVDGRGPGGFRYRLAFAAPTDRAPDDLVIDAGGFQVFVDPESAPKVKGVTIDFVEGLQESGFKIDNPNAAWADPLAAAVQKVLDDEINPAVASHGGAVVLMEVKDGVAYVEMMGGCQGCGMANVTLRAGIETRIKEAVPGIRAVTDVTDHAGGTNPYYASPQGGESPVA